MENIVNKIADKIGIDKLLHFFVGYFIASLGIPFGLMPAFISWGISILIGISKEILDQITYKGFDGMDLGVTVGGACVALIWFLMCTV